MIDGDRRFTWAETRERCHRLASALARRGIAKGRTVAVMAPNITAAFEASLAVPMTGGVLNAMNIRLDAPTITFILDHSEASVLLTDTEFAPVIREALKQVKRDILVIDVEDPAASAGERLGEIEYEAFLASGDPDFAAVPPDDEWDSISFNYTSGTRAAQGCGLSPPRCLSERDGQCTGLVWRITRFTFDPTDVSLQRLVLPLDHNNARRHPCLPAPHYVKNINDAIADHGVTHFWARQSSCRCC